MIMAVLDGLVIGFIIWDFLIADDNGGTRMNLAHHGKTAATDIGIVTASQYWHVWAGRLSVIWTKKDDEDDHELRER